MMIGAGAGVGAGEGAVAEARQGQELKRGNARLE